MMIVWIHYLPVVKLFVFRQCLESGEVVHIPGSDISAQLAFKFPCFEGRDPQIPIPLH